MPTTKLDKLERFIDTAKNGELGMNLCGSKNELAPISFNKIVSLVALLLLGIFLALVTIMFEKMGKQCCVVPGDAPPEFGRSVNPISTRGDRLCSPN